MAASKSKTLPGDLALWRRAIQSYRQNAKKRGIEWGLTETQAMKLMTQDCLYCKAPPGNITRAKNGRTILTGGIDRVNNEQGYHADNVVPCCGGCNIAKGDRSVEEFLTWAHRITRFTTEPVFKLADLSDRDISRHPVVGEVLDLYDDT